MNTIGVLKWQFISTSAELIMPKWNSEIDIYKGQSGNPRAKVAIALA